MSEGRKHILIVDDDKMVLFVLRRTLAGLATGVKISTAKDGHEALQIIDSEPIDLVITDIKMPGIDGITLTERLREKRDDIVVVWMTAFGCREYAAESDRLSVCSCLEKPLQINEIREAVEEAMVQKDSQACH